MPIRLAIYEDNHDLRHAFEVLFHGMSNIQLVGAYPNCLDIETHLTTNTIDVILMDIELPRRSGIEGTYLTKQISPTTEVLMLTVFEEEDIIFNALCAGATGYLLKKSSPTKIVEAIEDVYNGGAPMSPSIARKVLQIFPKQAAQSAELHKLSVRELEVLTSLSKGNSYKMVAADLGISFETVRTHVKRIYEKLHVHSVAEAVAKAFLK
ncbi:MAG: response regulator transcription factor [Saprospiraceae bacterium]|nr:response regulator transcription factor [Saprospiraceae bacterium]